MTISEQDLAIERQCGDRKPTFDDVEMTGGCAAMLAIVGNALYMDSDGIVDAFEQAFGEDAARQAKDTLDMVWVLHDKLSHS